MNLGVVFLDTFLDITLAALLATAAVTLMLRWWLRVHFGKLMAIFVLLGTCLVIASNSLIFDQMFLERHQAQNIWVPQDGCILYEPSPGSLFAKYSMSRLEFEEWVATHPFELTQREIELLDWDSERLGFKNPEASYATEKAPNGRQLRVYYVDGTMYLSYNVM